MRVNMAHLRERAVSGGFINFAVFETRSRTGSQTDNANLLAQLVAKAEAEGLAIDQAALAFKSNGRIQFFGTPSLTKYLSTNWHAVRWTHSLDI